MNRWNFDFDVGVVFDAADSVTLAMTLWDVLKKVGTVQRDTGYRVTLTMTLRDVLKKVGTTQMKLHHILTKSTSRVNCEWSYFLPNLIFVKTRP
jgi:hypothetical protein